MLMILRYHERACQLLSDQNTEKVVKSVKELALRVQWPFLSLSLAFLLYFFLGEKGEES